MRFNFQNSQEIRQRRTILIRDFRIESKVDSLLILGTRQRIGSLQIDVFTSQVLSQITLVESDDVQRIGGSNLRGGFGRDTEAL